MSRNKRNYDFYRAALLGVRGKDGGMIGDYHGLRSYADGFSAAEGYDLSNFDNWTKRQKKRVRDMYHDVNILRAQKHIVFRARNDKHLQIAQKVAHDTVNPKGLKVAFVKVATNERPKLIFHKESMTVKTANYSKVYIPFDQRQLVENAQAEYARIFGIVGDAQCTIQAGVNEIFHGGTEHIGRIREDGSAIGLAARIEKLKREYNGRHIPKSRKGQRWNPKHHDWHKWLIGVNAYTFPNQKALGEVLVSKSAAKAFQKKQQALTHKAVGSKSKQVTRRARREIGH